MNPTAESSGSRRAGRRFAAAIAALLLVPGLVTILAFATLLTTPTSAWVAGTPLVVTPTPTPPPTAPAETPMPNPHPAFEAGLAAYDRGNFREAERQFRLALALAPQEAALHNLSLIHI